MKSASFNEAPRAAEFIQSTANGTLSFETKPFSGGVFKPGEVVAELSGKYVKFDPAAVDGSQVAAAVSVFAVDAAAGDVDSLAVARLAEVTADRLFWPEGLAEPAPHVAELAVNTILVRGVQ